MKFDVYRAKFIPSCNPANGRTPHLNDLLISHKTTVINSKGDKSIHWEWKVPEKKYYVYRHIRLDKNEPFYIGIGHKDLKRNYVSEEKEYSRAFCKDRNEIWNKITNKTNYRVEILLEDLTMEEAYSKEIEFISLYGRKSMSNGILSNISEGGTGSHYTKNFSIPSRKGKYKPSKESIERSRLKRIGMVITPEARQKTSETLKRKIREGIIPIPDRIKHKDIAQYDTEWNLIKIWEDARPIRNVFSNFVIKNHANNNKLYKNFYWVTKTRIK